MNTRRYDVHDYENGEMIRQQTLREVIESCEALSDDEIQRLCNLQPIEILELRGYDIGRII